MIVAYEASHNSDGIEGRGHKVVDGYFTIEAAAQLIVKGKGPMGMSDGDVRRIYIHESLEEFHNWQRDELKKRALRKLTQEEIVALGLNPKDL